MLKYKLVAMSSSVVYTYRNRELIFSRGGKYTHLQPLLIEALQVVFTISVVTLIFRDFIFTNLTAKSQ